MSVYKVIPRFLLLWVGSALGIAVTQQTTGTSIDIASLITQIPLVFLVVWVISTRDKQWSGIMATRDIQWQTMITDRDKQMQAMMTERDAAWQKLMVERDASWRDAMNQAHDSGISIVSTALNEVERSVSEMTKIVSGNTARLQALAAKNKIQ